MLVLGRKVNQRIRIGDRIVITITDIRPGQVRLGIVAPGLAIDREEIRASKDRERDAHGLALRDGRDGHV